MFIITTEGMVQGICKEKPPKDWYGTVEEVSQVWETVESMYDDLGAEPNLRRGLENPGRMPTDIGFWIDWIPRILIYIRLEQKQADVPRFKDIKFRFTIQSKWSGKVIF